MNYIDWNYSPLKAKISIFSQLNGWNNRNEGRHCSIRFLFVVPEFWINGFVWIIEYINHFPIWWISHALIWLAHGHTDQSHEPLPTTTTKTTTITTTTAAAAADIDPFQFKWICLIESSNESKFFKKWKLNSDEI